MSAARHGWEKGDSAGTVDRGIVPYEFRIDGCLDQGTLLDGMGEGFVTAG
jgi:hypothetical protein